MLICFRKHKSPLYWSSRNQTWDGRTTDDRRPTPSSVIVSRLFPPVPGLIKDLVRIMVDADLELIGLESPGEGAKIIEKHHGNWHRWDSQVVSMGAHANHSGKEYS